MANTLSLKRIRTISELKKLLPCDDSDGEFYLLKDGVLDRVFIKRLFGPSRNGVYSCDERYFINHSPSFEESDFVRSVMVLELIDHADTEFHEYKNYGDMEYELKSGEFEAYNLEIRCGAE